MAEEVGRPKIIFTEKQWQTIDNLCKIHCTGEEIADVIEVDYDTLNARVNEIHNMNFSDYIKRYAGQGRASLRRMQWKSAEKGNTTMQIWLGKQILDQKDKQEVEHSGDLNTIINVLPASSKK